MNQAESATTAENSTTSSEGYVEDMDERLAAANATIRTHMYVSVGVGVIPIPLVDLVAISGVQMNMIRKISNLYGVTFTRSVVKNIISSLVGSVLPVGFASPVASLVKAIPVIGAGAGLLTMPVLSGASTYALGKVIVQHLESGGTFLDFDPVEVREYFKQEFEAGRTKVRSKA
jgi:uncharacterized protein (DUF697 family)